MALDPKDVQAAMLKIKKAEDLLRSLDDFATSLLGKTSEALDLIDTASGLLNGKLTMNGNGIAVEKDG